MRRSDQRRDAVFALYQRDVTGRPLDEQLADARPFTRELAEGTDAELESVDTEIARLSRGWELDRIAALERSIMRVALYEMRSGLPAEIAIDEAVNMAREYCGAAEPRIPFTNFGASAEQSSFAASIASSIATSTGTSSRLRISCSATRRMLRSSGAIRSSVQPTA